MESLLEDQDGRVEDRILVEVEIGQEGVLAEDRREHSHLRGERALVRSGEEGGGGGWGGRAGSRRGKWEL